MKRQIKRLLAVAVSLGICFSLCSCIELDELKEGHAILNENGSITLGGYEYKALPQCEEIWFDNDEMLRVTTDDVPVLLSDFWGTPAFINKDKTLISNTDNYNDFSNYYCRADKYDEMVETIKTHKLNHYYFEEYQYDEETQEMKIIPSLLSDSDTKVINSILNDARLVVDDADEIFNECEYITDINKCSSDLLFRGGSCAVYKSEQGKYYLSNEQESDDITIYEVPKKYVKLFDKLDTETDIAW